MAKVAFTQLAKENERLPCNAAPGGVAGEVDKSFELIFVRLSSVNQGCDVHASLRLKACSVPVALVEGHWCLVEGL